MKKFLTGLLTISMVFSMAQINFHATPESTTIVSKDKSTTFTIGDTATQSETTTKVNALYTTIAGNDVSMYPIVSFGGNGTYTKTGLPEGMNHKDVLKLITFARDTGFAKINSKINANGENALTDNDDLDIAITAALWGKYRYNMGVSTKYLDFDRNAGSKYIAAAKYIIDSYGNYTMPETTFSVNTDNIKTVAHSDDSYKYYGPFSFRSNNASIANATTQDNVNIVNSTWTPVDKNSLNAGTNYYVAIPKTSQAVSHAIKISLQYVEKDLAVYGTTSAKFIGVVNTPFKLNETFTIGDYATAKIYDNPGTVVNVRSDDGIYDKNITIGSNGVGYAENLSIGNYVARQITAPDGTVMNTTPKTFSITSTSDLVSIEFDTVSLFGTLNLTNVTNAGNILNGGIANIYTTDGTVYKTVTMQDTVSISMPIGRYSVQQETAVAGYVVDNLKQDFTIEPNKLTDVKIVNFPNGTVPPNPDDQNNGNNAHKGNGQITVMTKKEGLLTDEVGVNLTGNGIFLHGKPKEGQVIFKGLPKGGYVVSLTDIPNGYQNASAEVILPNDDFKTSVILNATKTHDYKEGELRVVIVDEFNNVIPDLSFDVFDVAKDKHIIAATTNYDGVANLYDLRTGKYKISTNANAKERKQTSITFDYNVTDNTFKSIKIVVPRANDTVATSNRQPLFIVDRVFDNYNTGVTTSMAYNDYKGSANGETIIVDGETYYIADNIKDYDGRIRIVVKSPKGDVVEGVDISVYNYKDKKVFTGTTNKDGELLLAGLDTKHEYHVTLKESTLHNAYAPKSSELVFEAKSNKTSKFVINLSDKEVVNDNTIFDEFGNIITNALVGKTTINITTVSTDGKRLDAEYTVYDANNKEVIVGKTVNGIATFTNDQAGTYTIKQTKIQSGYKLESEPYIFTMKPGTHTIDLTVTHEPVKYASLKGFVFNDKNSNKRFDAGEGQSGVQVVVSNGVKSVVAITDNAGNFTVTDLPIGKYSVKANIAGVQFIQKSASSNDKLDSDSDSNGVVTVNIEGTDVTDIGIGFQGTFVNSNNTSTPSVPSVPKTGDIRKDNSIYLGVSILCLAGIFLVNRKSIIK